MTRRELERRLDALEADEGDDEPEDPTDLWRAFNDGGITLEEWKQSAKQ